MNEEIIRLREAGMPYRALADKFGCSDRTIGRWLRDNGIKPRPRHVPPPPSPDELRIDLSWTTIRTPYVKPQWFSNVTNGR